MENAAQVCREGGARVSTNIFLQDLDLDLKHVSMDGRRVEVVAEGLSLFGGSQLALDATLVSALHANGSTDGTRTEQTALRCWKREDTKRRCARSSMGRMVVRVVIAGEVGGRWSEETKVFLWSLVCEKSRQSCLVPCGAASWLVPQQRRSMSLLERRGVPGLFQRFPPKKKRFLFFVLARRHFTLWTSAHSGDDQVKSRILWAVAGSSPTVPESSDWCPPWDG